MSTPSATASPVSAMGDPGRNDYSGTLLHLCTPTTWRMALAADAVATPSLFADGFVHLSTPAQVELPANTLFAGRTDLVALVIDPARLPGELRFEPARGDAPPGMCFPHHYGPVPTNAVVAVMPYQPGPDGRFTTPTGLPAPQDVAARVRLFDRALAQRRAAAVVPVDGGVAVLDPRFPASYEHNTVWFDRPGNAATVATEAARVLGVANLTHRRVVFDGPAPAGELAGRGWRIQELRLMVWDGRAVTQRPKDVVAVTHEVVSRLWERSWRRDLPDVDEETVCQLVSREPLADTVLRLVDLAVLDDSGDPIASAQVRIDGATAAIEAVLTEPAHRRTGLARNLVLDAVARAQAAGCDVVFLSAAADDWPGGWYARLGFIEVSTRFEATID
ncbi:MAG: GNAT family N-acetyltransferase [Pseudonocardiaceae bacterium]